MDLFQVVSFLPDNPRRCKLAAHARTIVELKQRGASFGMISAHLQAQSGLLVSRQTVAQYYHRVEAKLRRATQHPQSVAAGGVLSHTDHTYEVQGQSTAHPGHLQVAAELRQHGASFGLIADHLKAQAGISVTPENLALQLKRAGMSDTGAHERVVSSDGRAIPPPKAEGTAPATQDGNALVREQSQPTPKGDSGGCQSDPTGIATRNGDGPVALSEVVPPAAAYNLSNPDSSASASSRSSGQERAQESPLPSFDLQSQSHRSALEVWRALHRDSSS